MSAFNNSKRKNKSRQNYKIESLEPRLLMDASYKADSWLDEISDVTVSKKLDESNSNNFYNLFTNGEVGTFIDGLYKKDGDGSYSDYVQFSTLQEMDQNFSKYLPQPMAKEIMGYVKTDFKNFFAGKSNTTKLTAKDVFDLVKQSGMCVYDAQTDVLTRSFHVEYGTDVKSQVNVSYDIGYKNGSVSINVKADTSLKDYSRELGDTYRKYTDQIKADVKGVESLGFDSSFDFAGYTRGYEFSFELDGTKNTQNNLSSTVMLYAMFDEIHSKEGEDVLYGVLGLEGDVDSSIDLWVGRGVTIDSSDEETVKNGVGADLSVELKERALFDNSTGLHASLRFEKDFLADEGSWTYYSNGKQGFANVEDYNKITMGRINTKLQELSVKLADVQNGAFGGTVNFGILAQNVNSLLNLSKMLDDALTIGRGTNNPHAPQSIQELVLNLNKKNSYYGFGKEKDGFKITVDQESESLVIPFSLKFVDEGNGKKTSVESQVSLAKRALETILDGSEILSNTSVTVESSATMTFNLVVPFYDYIRSNKNTKLSEIGFASDDEDESIENSNNRLKTVIGADVYIGANRVAFEHSEDFDGYVKGVAGELSCGNNYCVDSATGTYALYSKHEKDSNAFDESKLNGYEEIAYATAQCGFVFSWDGEKKIKCFGASYEVDCDGCAEKINRAIRLNSKCGAGTRAVAFDGKVIVLFGFEVGDVESQQNEIDALKKYLNNNINLKFDTLYDILISDALAPSTFSTAGKEVEIKVTVGGSSKSVSIGVGAFKNLSSVADIAFCLQQRIDKVFGWKNARQEMLLVENYENHIRFLGLRDFTVNIKNAEFAKWLGFDSVESGKKDSENSSYCMKITTSKSGDILISLKSLVESKCKTKEGLLGLKISEILNAIATASNGKITVKNGVELCTVDEKDQILFIEDVNGFTIASMLCLTGDYSAHSDFGRPSFKAEMNLDESLQQQALVKIEDFNLKIENEVVNGNVKLPARYGVFGVNISGNLKGLKSETCFCIKDKTGTDSGKPEDLCVSSYSYTTNAQKLTLTLNETVGGKRTLGSLEFLKVGSGNPSTSNGLSAIFVKNSELEKDSVNALESYTPSKLNIDLTYQNLYSSIVSLEKYFENGNAAQSLLKNSTLPIYGKDVLDIMGFKSEMSDIKMVLTRDYRDTLQEITTLFAKKLGISLTFKLESTGLSCDLEWHKLINQQVELGKLGLGIDGLKINGRIEALLEANLTLMAHIDISLNSKGQIVFTLDEQSNKPKIKGSVTISAQKIETDMLVNVANGSSNTETFHVTSNNDNVSFLRIGAEYGLNETSGEETLDMSVSGALHFFRYGVYSGAVTIGVAEADAGEIGDLKWKDSASFAYSLQNHSFGAAAIWYNKATKKNEIKKSDESEKILKDDIVIDLSQIDDLREVNLSDWMCNAAEGLNNTVRRIQSSLLSTLIKKEMRSIPLLCDTVINIGDCLDKLNEEFVEPIRKFAYGLTSDPDGESVSGKLHTMFKKSSSFGLDEEGLSSVPVMWAGKKFTGYYKGIQYGSDEEQKSYYWHMRLKGEYTLAANADLDLGYPGLGLEAEGGVDISLEWTLDVGFGVSLIDGAFLLLSNGSELTADTAAKNAADPKEALAGDDFTAKIKITPADTNQITGSLGFLALTAKLKEFVDNDGCITLGLDFNDGGEVKVDSDTKDRIKTYAEKELAFDKKANTVFDMDTLASDLSLETSLRGTLPIKVDMTLGIGGYQDSAPHIDTTLGVTWKSELGQENAFGSVSEVIFTGIVFDSGSFIRNTVGPTIEKINKILDPIQPLIKFLQSEVPVLNKLPKGKFRMTILDLVKKFGKGKMNFGFIDDLISLKENVEKLQDFAYGGYAFSDIVLYAENYIDEKIEDGKARIEEAKKQGLDYINQKKKAGMDYLEGKVTKVEDFIKDNYQYYETKAKGVVKYATEYKDNIIKNAKAAVNGVVETAENYKEKAEGIVNTVKSVADSIPRSPEELIKLGESELAKVEDKAEKWLSEKDDRSSSEKTDITTPKFSGSFEIPLFSSDAGKQILTLLMGGHADLFKFDMAPLEFNFSWSKSFPIVGPLCADVGFNFGVSIDLCFGYDTLGFEMWKESDCKDYAALLNGFYIADWGENGNDVAEVVFHSGANAGASVCGRAGINVALNLNVNLDLADPNDDGKVRFAELAGMLTDPINMFDASATIEAKAYAYLDYFFGTKKWNLWSSGALSLFETKKAAHDNGTELAGKVGDETVVYVGRFAEERRTQSDDKTDGDDVVKITITGSDTVTVEWNDEKQENVKVEGSTLAVYAGEGKDKVTIVSDGAACAQFNIKVYGENGDDGIDMSNALMDSGYTAVVMGGMGNNDIRGIQNGDNYLFGNEGMVTYDKAGSDNKKRVVKAEAYSVDGIAGGNFIVGGGAFNVIFGGAGSDVIVGGDGTNYIFGDSGRYRNKNGEVVVDREDLFVEGGNDIIYGGNGVKGSVEHKDYIFGGAGNDTIFGLAGNDEIHGGQGNDIIYGGSGNDLIYGDDGADIVFGDSPIADLHIASSDGKGTLPYIFVPGELRNDSGKISLPSIDSSIKSDSAEKSSGDDEIHGGNGSDILYGDKGAMTASGGKDVIYGDAGDDFVNGDGGNDTLYGNYGMDVLYGGAGDDTLDGGAGDDFVFGKNGEIGYKALSKESVNKWVGETADTKGEDFVAAYGDMLRVAGQHFGIGSNSKYGQDDGDDTIIAGEGNDFVDGQTGNDVYKIHFQGGDKRGYTNVMDSGDDHFDKLNVFGTSNDETVVISVSDDGLAKIATRKNEKGVVTELERVNFWGNALEFASLETGVGNDIIYVECTPCIMEIDAGGGNDSIHIGGVNYMKPSDNSNVNPLDVYDASVIQTVSGSLSIGASHALSVKAGSGDDSITVDHTSAALGLYGNMGNDTFTLNALTDSKGNVIDNLGGISIVGGGDAGKNNDEVNARINKVYVNGPSRSSTYSIVGRHLTSSFMDVTFSGVADLYVKGGENSDKFYLRDLITTNYDIDSSSAGDQVFMAWTVDDEALKERDVLSQTELNAKFNNYEDVFGNVNDEIEKQSSKKTIAVRVFQNGDILDSQCLKSSDISSYNALFATITYAITLSDAPKGKVTIRVMVPNVSDDDELRGAGKVAINGSPDYVDLTFDASNYNISQFVTITNLKTSYLQKEGMLCAYHEVITEKDEDVVEAPCVFFSFDYTDTFHFGKANGFTETVQCEASECTYDSSTGRYSVKMPVNQGFENMKPIDLSSKKYDSFHFEIGEKFELVNHWLSADFKLEFSGDEVILSWNSYYDEVDKEGKQVRTFLYHDGNELLDPDDIIYFSYVTNKWYLNEESSVLLRSSMDDYDPYGGTAEKPEFVFELVLDGDSTIYTLRTEKESKSNDKYFYKEEGHRIIICSKETGEAVQVTGVITLDEKSLEWDMPKEYTFSYSSVSFKDALADDGYTVYKDPRGKKPYVAVHVPEDSNGKNYHIDMNLWNGIDVNWLGKTTTIEDWTEKYALPSRSKADVVYIYLQDNLNDWGTYDNTLKKYIPPAYEGRLSAYYSNEPGK